jgi:hypothetical protein
MSWDPSVYVFTRFRAANTLNLLYLQAEICGLEEELKLLTEIDDGSPDPRLSELSFDWEALRCAEEDGIDRGEGGGDQQRGSRQWRLCLELRRKLAEYSKFRSFGRSMDSWYGALGCGAPSMVNLTISPLCRSGTHPPDHTQ